MPSVPAHSVVSHLSNQSGLTLKRQACESVGDSAIVIKMLAAGVCGTDLAILSGNRASQAGVLGHEGVGIVIESPPDCSFSQGTRVVINPVHRERPQAVIGHSCDGVFRELFCLRATDAVEGGFLVSCSTGLLADTELALAEPIASVLYSLELLCAQCGDVPLLIRGSGTVDRKSVV